ncbi:hypothetical protein C8R47DRAFT_1083468 [Mycena vitilis]|nr:hypothetical protein C8R47DRAFT_1083468 [Mycena vitilis]
MRPQSDLVAIPNHQSCVPPSGTQTAAWFCRRRHVHPSILSAASTVFKDLFEVAQVPNNADSQVDGYPLVQLYSDKAQDVEIILQALHDWCVKNQVKTVGESLPRFIEPVSGTLLITTNEFKKPDRPPIQHYPGLIFDTIARETNLLSILPAAFYRACSASVSHEIIVQSVKNGEAGIAGDIVYIS